jgi:hypothetical protein
MRRKHSVSGEVYVRNHRGIDFTSPERGPRDRRFAPARGMQALGHVGYDKCASNITPTGVRVNRNAPKV